MAFSFRVAHQTSGGRRRVGAPGARRSLLLIESRLRRLGACEANFLSGDGLRLRGSLFNKICDRSWLRYVDGVASLDLNDRSTRALGHSTLGVRWNHPVPGGDQVPARLGPPRGTPKKAPVELPTVPVTAPTAALTSFDSDHLYTEMINTTETTKSQPLLSRTHPTTFICPPFHPLTSLSPN